MATYSTGTGDDFALPKDADVLHGEGEGKGGFLVTLRLRVPPVVIPEKTTGLVTVTQFYPVDFFTISVKKCNFNKRTIKVCTSCFVSWDLCA